MPVNFIYRGRGIDGYSNRSPYTVLNPTLDEQLKAESDGKT